MSRRSINGHSRRRRNKASALKKTEASPLKSTLEENKMLAVGGAMGGFADPTTMLIGAALDRSAKRKEIEAETGRDFKNLREARMYKKGGAEDASAWQAVLEDLEETTRVDPPGSQL